MKISLLTVGDEILIGQVVDTNSAWMGQQLNLAGARVVTVISVGDTMAAIHTGIQIGRASCRERVCSTV